MNDIRTYKRIIIVGNNGSGKSFLARELAVRTGLPVAHLDNEYWKPNWEAPPREEWIRRQTELLSGEKWIVDGNYNGTMELRFRAADLVLFPDVNRFTCLLGILRRHGKTRPDIPQYLDDKFDKNFFLLCKGMWSFPKTRKKTILDLHQKYPETPFLIIKGRRGIRKLLKQWRIT